MANGSFYQNGLPLSTLETGLGNVNPGAPVANKSSSSFYLNGTAYSALQSSDTLMASINAQLAAAVAAASSALGSTVLLKANSLSDVASVAAAKANLSLVSSDVGLGNATNTSDANKPVSTAQATADALVASNAATATALKANIASPTFTGVASAPTAAANTNNTQLATTAYADAINALRISSEALKAPLASPALTGVPVAPTATVGTNTTQLATTAFVQANPTATASTAPAHKFATAISGAGALTYTQPDAADITFTAAGGTTRSANSRFNDTYSVMDYGADPTGVADSAPAFRLALASAPYGGKVTIPAGNFLLNSPDPATGGAGILDFSNFPNKSITLEGVGWNLKVGGVYTAPSGSILRIGASIPTTCDFLYIPMNDRVTGLRLKDFAVVAAAGVFNTAHGRHGVHIDGTTNVNGYVEFFTMDNVFCDNMANGYSVLVQGLSTGNTMIDSVIRNCTLMNAKFDYVADNITVEGNVFGANAFGTTNGPNTGLYVNQVSGATSFRILGNNFVNQDGMIVIASALSPIIQNNEFEQNPGANAHGALVDLSGGIGTGVIGAIITGSSIAQNSTTASYPPINLGTTVGTQVFGNTIRVPSAYAHVTIGSGSSRTLIGHNLCFTSGSASDMLVTDGGSLTENDCVWKTYTPTITADAGTFTTVSATGAYRVLGKLLFFEQDITITTVGSASGAVHATLPAGFTAKRNGSASGKEFATNGFMLGVVIQATFGATVISKYDNTSIIGAGAELVISGCIEIT